MLDQVLGSTNVAEGRTYSIRELAEYSGASVELIRELLTSDFWMTKQTQNTLNMMCLLPELALNLWDMAFSPRHLRAFKSAADREISLVEIAVAPLASRRDAASQTQAQERADKIRKLCLQLHATLVESAMPTYN